MELTGAQIVVEALRHENINVIFGYPGGSVLPLFDTLYDASDIQLILTRHEQAAAHAADGLARATGKVGVCIATSGPGATNLVTGIATACMDSIPMVAITGQVKTFLIGDDAFQEADMTGITRSITKHNFLVKDIRELAKTLKEAFYIARTGRPGPVLVDLPVDIQNEKTEFVYPQEVSLRAYQPTYKGHPGQIKKAVRAITASSKPVIYAGGGVIVSGASEELLQFAERIQAPVTTTLMAMGAFPGDHPLSLGMLGMRGTVYANNSIMESDLIIAVGARFGDRTTGKVEAFAPHAEIIHIDIDPTSISKNIEADIPIVGDAKLILQEMLALLKELPDTAQWLKQVREWKQRYPLSYKNDTGAIKPQFVVEQIHDVTNGEAIITTEVGQNQMWAAQYYTFRKPRTFISSGGLGTMGYGFPAAMGAQLGCPGKVVFDIAGDGSIVMNIQELATVSWKKIPVKIAILNNCFLGMVRQWQELFFKKRYSHTCLVNPDFVKVAESFGVKGIKVEKKEEVRPALEEALKTDGPVVLDFHVDQEENVYPMVPAGEAINRMIGMA